MQRRRRRSFKAHLLKIDGEDLGYTCKQGLARRLLLGSSRNRLLGRYGQNEPEIANSFDTNTELLCIGEPSSYGMLARRADHFEGVL